MIGGKYHSVRVGLNYRVLSTGVEGETLFAKTIGEDIEKAFMLEDNVLVTEEDVQRDQIMPAVGKKTAVTRRATAVCAVAELGTIS